MLANSFGKARLARQAPGAGKCNCDIQNRCRAGPVGEPGEPGVDGEPGDSLYHLNACSVQPPKIRLY